VKILFSIYLCGEFISCVGRVGLWGKSETTGSSNYIVISIYIFEGYILVYFSGK
jgi:hypothetical protein